MDTIEVRSEIGRFDTCNGNAKSVRAFPGVTESIYCLMPSTQAEHCIPDRRPCHSVRASPPWTTYSPRRACSSAGTNVVAGGVVNSAIRRTAFQLI